MKFKARYILERENEIEAASAADVYATVEKALRSTGMKYKVLGVIPADQAWPDTEEVTARPPRNTPPSGSPGTPVSRVA